MRKALALLGLIGGGTVMLACWAYRPPTDLSLSSVKIVGGADRDLLRDIGNRGWHELFARITFTTARNLAQFGHNEIYSGLVMETYYCKSTQRAGHLINQGDIQVYDEVGSITVSPGSGRIKGKHTYHVYIKLKQTPRDGIEPYNLVKTPDDVCFVVVPYLPHVGFWPPTNELRVSRDELIMALHSMNGVPSADN